MTVIVDVTFPYLIRQPLTPNHNWNLPVNYPVFSMVMVIYRYIERLGELSLPLIFVYNIYDHEKILSR